MIYYGEYISPLGEIGLLADEDDLTGLWIKGRQNSPVSGSVKIYKEENEILIKTKRWLCAYFSGEKPDINELNLSLRVGDFARDVLKRLMEIPYGHTVTYGDIARGIAAERGISKMSAQAVGGAVGHNPIPIIIPCHRVVGTGGKLVGYTGGLDIKIYLLSHEGIKTEKNNLLF